MHRWESRYLSAHRGRQRWSVFRVRSVHTRVREAHRVLACVVLSHVTLYNRLDRVPDQTCRRPLLKYSAAPFPFTRGFMAETGHHVAECANVFSSRPTCSVTPFNQIWAGDKRMFAKTRSYAAVCLQDVNHAHILPRYQQIPKGTDFLSARFSWHFVRRSASWVDHGSPPTKTLETSTNLNLYLAQEGAKYMTWGH